MCGIFGFVANPNSKLNSINSRRILIDLFHRSEPRGRDASGFFKKWTEIDLKLDFF